VEAVLKTAPIAALEECD